MLQKPMIQNIIRHFITKSSCIKLSNTITSLFENGFKVLEEETAKMDDMNYRLIDAVNAFKILITSLVPNALPVIIYSIATCNKVKKIIRKYGMNEMDAETMWGNRRENIANQMNHNIMRMAIILKKILQQQPELDNELRKLMKEKKNDQIYAWIHECSQSSDEQFISFSMEWNEFMKKFGYRGPAEFDVGVPRYEHRPSMILSMVMNIDVSGYKDEDACDHEREEATERILVKLSKKDRKKVEKMLPITQLFLIHRETPKYMVVSILALFRKMIVRKGEYFVSQGLIDDVSDVFFITMEELNAYEAGEIDGMLFRGHIQSRRSNDEAGRTMQFPRLIFGPECIMRTISDATYRELNDLPLSIMKGVPTSAGVVEGRAVVATDPETCVINKGEILVARATDPGWTPLFVPAAAVAIEIGGPLTHGSVVAREMGIPCVVGAIGLMSRVKSGMKIRVDGYKGIVEILEDYCVC